MIKYIWMWKLKEGTTEEDKKLARQYLDELPKRVGWVRSSTWGEALATLGEPLTHCFTADFDDVAALNGFLEHPDRLIIQRRLDPYIAESVATYYEWS